MVRTLPPRKATFAPAGERRRLQQIQLAQQRAELVEIRRRAAESVAAADAKLGAVDREIAIVLAAASMSGVAQKAVGRKPPAARPAQPKKIAGNKAVSKPRAKARAATPRNAAAPTPGSTSATIAGFLARRPTQTFSPSQIRDATGINTALVMKTLQRMHNRGQVQRIDKGVYSIARKG